jgi:hypothetical protein
VDQARVAVRALSKQRATLTSDQYRQAVSDLASLGAAKLKALAGQLAVRGVGDADHPMAAATKVAEQAVLGRRPPREAAPPPAAAKAPSPAPSRLERVVGSLDGHLARAAGLTAEQKSAYKGAAEHVLSRMSEKALEAFEKNVESVTFVKDLPSVNEEILARYARPDASDAARDAFRKKQVGGAYGGSDRRVIVDGGFDQTRDYPEQRYKNLKLTREIYAHEFAHAVDGPDHAHSHGEEWKAIYAEEINTTDENGLPRLTGYARGDAPHEGWAEFGRLVFSGDHDPADIKAYFPKAYAYWEKHGLAPAAGVAMSAEERRKPRLRNIFIESVRLPGGGGHADVLAPDAGGAEGGDA